MPLIFKEQESQKEKIRIEIHSDVLAKVDNYCQWVNVEKSYFFEEAAKFILNKDKEYNRQFKRKYEKKSKE